MNSAQGQRGRPTSKQEKAIFSLRAAVSAAEAAAPTKRRSLVWSFIVGLSSMALGLYHPAMAQDEPWRDRSPAPCQPDPGFRPFGDLLGRPIGSDDPTRVRTSPLYMAAVQEMDGPPTHHFEIPAGELQAALTIFSRQTEMQLLYVSELVSGVQTKGIQGDYTVDEALRVLLAGTGLEHRFTDSKTVVVQRAERAKEMVPPPPAPVGLEQSKPIRVPEILVKDVREKPSWTTPTDGYKADHASTVTRSTMSIAETPTSIGVVTRDLIKDTFSRTQGDAFEAVSGVTRNQVNGARSESFNIRGFSGCDPAGDFFGMKSNGLPADCLFAPDWGIVERYEIVKGPASIVGGASNPGGIVNRITKTPQRSNFANVEANFGSYDFYRGLVDANGVLPKYDNIRGRLVVAVEEGGAIL